MKKRECCICHEEKADGQVCLIEKATWGYAGGSPAEYDWVCDDCNGDGEPPDWKIDEYEERGGGLNCGRSSGTPTAYTTMTRTQGGVYGTLSEM